MSAIEIIASLGLIAVIVGVAWWFAVKEQKAAKPGPVDLDERTLEGRRRAATDISNYVS
jgi:hypothetical protein